MGLQGISMLGHAKYARCYAASPGSSPTPATPTHMRTQGADLVVVEFASNDHAAPDVSGQVVPCECLGRECGATAMQALPPGPLIKSAHFCPKCVQYSYVSPHRRSYEQVLRRLLRLPSKPAVLLLQTYAWWFSHGDGIPEGLYYKEPEIEMTVLGQVSWLVPTRGWLWLQDSGKQQHLLDCSLLPLRPIASQSTGAANRVPCFLLPQYYDLPVMSLRAAAWHLMHAGIEGFKVRWSTSPACLCAGAPAVIPGTVCPASCVPTARCRPSVAGRKGDTRAGPDQPGQQIARNPTGRRI